MTNPQPIPAARFLSPLGTTLIASFAALALTSQLYFPLPLLTNLAHEFGIMTTTATLSTSVFGIAYALGFLLVGPLGQVFGPARLTAVSLGIVTLGSLGAALAPNWTLFLVARAITGLAGAALVPSMLVLLGTRLHPRNRAVAISTFISTSFSAGIIAQIAAQAFEALVGWRGVFVIGAIALAISTITVAAGMRDTTESRSHPLRGAYSSLPRVARDRRLLPLYLATLTILGTFVLLYTGIQLAHPVVVSESVMIAFRATAIPAMVLAPILMAASAQMRALTRCTIGFAITVVSAGVVAMHLGVVVTGISMFALVGALAVIAPSIVTEIGERAGANRQAGAAIYSFWLFAGASLGAPLAAALTGAGLMTTAIVAAVALAIALAATLIAARTSTRISNSAR